MSLVADYFIHGRGRGHASRYAAVQDGLTRRGFGIRVYAGGSALDVLNGAQAPIFQRDPLRRGPLSPLSLAARSLSDCVRFSANRPSLIVSDGDQGAILGGRAAGIPVLAVGHDLVFNGNVSLPQLPVAALLSQRANALATRAATGGVAVHFLPACSDNPRIRVARPEGSHAGNCDRDRALPVICYFRDGNGRLPPLSEAGPSSFLTCKKDGSAPIRGL